VRDLTLSGDNDVYVYNALVPDAANPTVGTEYFTVPQNAIIGSTQPTLTPITPPGQATGMVMVASGALSPGLRLATAQTFTNLQVDIRAGDLGPTQLSPIDATKLPEVDTLPSLLEAPLTAPYARIFTDELVWIGTPADSNKGRGIDLVWYSYATKSMRAVNTGSKRLLATTTGITNSAITLAGAATPTSAVFDLVWTQDAGNGHVTLTWGEIHCTQ
jgi:hypothetical protein